MSATTNRPPALAGVAVPLAGSLLAIAAAALTGALVLLLMGKHPTAVYQRLLSRGLLSEFGVTETLIKCAPLLIVAAGLLVTLKAGVWNIGIDGQFLVGAALTGFIAPRLIDEVPLALMLLLAGSVGFLGGLAWAIVPALLRVRYGLNEIITTIMMSYVAISLTAYLVKGPFKDPTVVPPQTEVLPRAWRLPDLPGTEVHAGLVIGLIAVLFVAALFRATTLGVKLWVLGQSRRAALHAGLPVGGLTATALLLSGGFAGLAGANDVLSTAGLFKANWYPEYGLAAFALVYLARLRPLWVLPFAYFFGWLELSRDLLRSEDVPNYYVGMLEGLMLLYLAVATVIERRWHPVARRVPDAGAADSGGVDGLSPRQGTGASV